MRYIPGVNRPYGYAHAGKLHRHSGAAENCGGEAIHTDEVCDPAPPVRSSSVKPRMADMGRSAAGETEAEVEGSEA